jgi:hypothetical protein
MEVVGAELVERARPAHQLDVVRPDIHQEEPHVLAPQLMGELRQRAHAVQVHDGDRTEVDHDRVRVPRAHELQHRVPEVVGVGEEERTVHAHDHDSRNQLRLGVMVEVHVDFALAHRPRPAARTPSWLASAS